MKEQITFLKTKITTVIFVMLTCFIALPSLYAQSVLPNVRVNTSDYNKVDLDGGQSQLLFLMIPYMLFGRDNLQIQPAIYILQNLLMEGHLFLLK